MKKKLMVSLASIILVMLVGMLVSFLKTSWALENDSRVGEESPITFYIDVMYDGTDREAVTSSKTTIAKVYSDYIYVQDKLQEGLEFEGFVETSDGTIGAVGQNNSPQACLGYVVDGVDGLSYDANTRIISFKVRNLMAGCKLTVGVQVRTPKLNQYVPRMDFYNTASGLENNDSAKSNTVHFYIGRDTADLYKVTYQFVGDVPQGAENLLPSEKSYNQGMIVGVENDVILDGYTFSGWTSENVILDTDGRFAMPGEDIVFVGSFTPGIIPEYKVHYSIEGEVPEEFVTPKDKNYRPGKEVTLDGLKEGDVVNGYRFLGWSIETGGVEVSEFMTFEMPEKDVNVVGKFEKILYTVKYEFMGTNIPPNASSLLPVSTTHAPGETIILASDPTVDGYKFLGWYSAPEFMMPEENVVIQGEWMLEDGVFRPIITKVITNEQEYYYEGEEVFFEITVKNDRLFSIYDVQLSERLEGTEFIEGDGYTVKNASYVVIDEIPGGTSAKVQAKYRVQEESFGTLTNIVELTGAITKNNYNLDPDGEYEASVDFDVDKERVYKVTYKFTGDIPEGAENLLPSEKTYNNDITVRVENDVILDGYNFSGWASADVEVDSNGEFSMPEKDIVFEGKFTIPEYTVHYSIEGEIPNEYILPRDQIYPVGSNVSLDSLKAGDIINGYRFLGWNIETDGVDVSESLVFVMPRENVDIVGMFEKVVYTVRYEFTGENIPSNATDLLPSSSTYAPGENVSLATDPSLDGYKFLGWISEDVNVDVDGNFTIPDKDVVFVGKFEKLYIVSYEFIGENIPSDVEDLLPKSSSYVQGEKAALATDPISDGYIFSGWTNGEIEVDADGKFIMPEKDIVIQGVWKVEVNTFSPIISKKIVNEKEYYHEGEEVIFEITIKNNKSFSLYEVQLFEKLEDAEFIEGDGYTIVDSTHVVIDEIASESEITVQAKFKAKKEILKTITNTVELTDLITNNNYTLDSDAQHIARVDFNVANLGLEIIKINENNEVLSGAKFGLYRDSDATDLINKGQKFEMLEPNKTYYLKEVGAPKGYELDSKILKVTVSSTGEVKVGNLEVEMEEGTGKVKIVNKKIDDTKSNGILSTLLPSTGDNIYTFVGLLIISIIVIGAIVFYFIKDVRKNQKDKETLNTKNNNDD